MVDPPSWLTSPDPAVVERQALLKQLGIADDPNLSVSQLRERTGYGADAETASRVGGYDGNTLGATVDSHTTDITNLENSRKLEGAEFLNPVEYGAVPDNATNNYTALTSLLADALTLDREVYWPPGTFVYSGNLANLHKVRHYGPGKIREAAVTFYPQASSTDVNTLYVRTGGSDANDGLLTSRAFLTIQAAFDALENYGPYVTGVWTIDIGAGTFAKAVFPPVSSHSVITITGATVGHPNVPTTLITNGYNHSGYGINAFFVEASLHVKDIHFSGYNATTASVGVGYADSPGELFTTNCHYTDCYWGASIQRSNMDVKGGIFTRCGFLGSTPNTDPPATRAGTGAGTRTLMNSVHSIGLQNAGVHTQGPFFRFCYQGVFTQEGGTGHVDWSTFEDCLIGINAGSRSRVNSDGSIFARNGMDIRTLLNSDVYVTANNVFATGADESSAKLVTTSGSQIIDDNRYFTNLSPVYSGTMKALDFATPDMSIQTTGPTVAYTRTLKGNIWRDGISPIRPRKQLRLFITGSLIGTAGTKIINVKLGTAIVGATYASTETGVFSAEVDIVFNNVAEQRLFLRTSRHLGTSIRSGAATGTNAMTADTTLTVEGTVGVATDTIVINTVRMDMI